MILGPGAWVKSWVMGQVRHMKMYSLSHLRLSKWNKTNLYKTNQGTRNIYWHKTISSKIQFRTPSHTSQTRSHTSRQFFKEYRKSMQKLFYSHLHMNNYTTGVFISRDFTGLADPHTLDYGHMLQHPESHVQNLSHTSRDFGRLPLYQR